MRIGIDMGHTLSGAGTGAGSKYASETDKNRLAGKRLIEMLKEKGHTVINCTVDRSNNDLYDRVQLANAQTLDLFVSLHLNAYKETTNPMGVETYIYSGSYNGKEANRAIAQRVQTKLVNAIGWKDRKVKEANYYVLRETKAPAILVEMGFCDSKADMDIWNTEKIAKALFEGITNTTYTSNTSSNASSNTTVNSNVFFRVVVGSYSQKSNAIAKQNELKSKANVDSFLDAFVKDNTTFFRVIAGSYNDKINAEKQLKLLKSKGFDCFIAAYTK